MIFIIVGTVTRKSRLVALGNNLPVTSSLQSGLKWLCSMITLIMIIIFLIYNISNKESGLVALGNNLPVTSSLQSIQFPKCIYAAIIIVDQFWKLSKKIIIVDQFWKLSHKIYFSWYVLPCIGCPTISQLQISSWLFPFIYMKYLFLLLTGILKLVKEPGRELST